MQDIYFFQNETTNYTITKWSSRRPTIVWQQTEHQRRSQQRRLEYTLASNRAERRSSIMTFGLFVHPIYPALMIAPPRDASSWANSSANGVRFSIANGAATRTSILHIQHNWFICAYQSMRSTTNTVHDDHDALKRASFAVPTTWPTPSTPNDNKQMSIYRKFRNCLKK